MKVVLVQLDGKIPNLALMRISHHHKSKGDSVRLVKWSRAIGVLVAGADKIYVSIIFKKSRKLVAELFRQLGVESTLDVVVGGTGWDETITLFNAGITTEGVDYSLYSDFEKSIGFTQRGCRLRCPFCVVPKKEGAIKEEMRIVDIWRGDPWPRELLLLDNDFFGQPNWRDRVREIREGGFKVNFNQGINARFLTDESAEAIASVDYRDDSMKVKRIYTAWDNRKDEHRLFSGLEALVRYGVKPDHIMVYMLIGYWPGETHTDRDHRRKMLREFGARPYPMAYERTKELVGFQRWVIGAYDKRVDWNEWEIADYEPRKL